MFPYTSGPLLNIISGDAYHEPHLPKGQKVVDQRRHFDGQCQQHCSGWFTEYNACVQRGRSQEGSCTNYVACRELNFSRPFASVIRTLLSYL